MENEEVGEKMATYRHCATEGAAERQRQFENALLTLLETKGLEQISIQEICSQVGLSRKSFYRYFSGKEGCLEALVDHAILDFAGFSFTEGQIQQMLEQFFSYWYQRKGLLDALTRHGRENLLFNRAILCADQEYGIRDFFREENGTYERSVFFISGLFGVLQSWHGDGCQKTPAQLAAVLAGHMFRYQ